MSSFCKHSITSLYYDELWFTHDKLSEAVFTYFEQTHYKQQQAENHCTPELKPYTPARQLRSVAGLLIPHFEGGYCSTKP